MNKLGRKIASDRMASQNARPPLAGIKVVEFAGLAPGPFAGSKPAETMLSRSKLTMRLVVLADFGAESAVISELAVSC